VVGIPQRRRERKREKKERTAYERVRTISKKGSDFRAGIEGTISVLIPRSLGLVGFGCVGVGVVLGVWLGGFFLVVFVFY